jgi:hypothetical protein
MSDERVKLHALLDELVSLHVRLYLVNHHQQDPEYTRDDLKDLIGVTGKRLLRGAASLVEIESMRPSA